DPLHRPANGVTVTLTRISVRNLRESGLRLARPFNWEVAQIGAAPAQNQAAADRPKDNPDTVSGTVVNDQQVPIPNVRILIQKADSGELLDGYQKVTDAEGRYSVNLPEPGDFILSLLADGYHSVELLVIKEAGKE